MGRGVGDLRSRAGRGDLPRGGNLNAGDLALLVIGLVALGTIGASAWVLWTVSEERRYGALLRVDPGSGSSPPLRSPRWRLSGTPDELRQLRDGAIVPVEWKRRAAPPGGPFLSHRVQVWAYCLLVEETWGRAPPFGVVRYGDGVEFRVPWDRDAYTRVIAVRRAVAARYDGEATPSAGRCSGCAYRNACDVRAA